MCDPQSDPWRVAAFGRRHEGVRGLRETGGREDTATGAGHLVTLANPFARPSRRGAPLRGRYLVKSPAWNTWLRANDYVMELVASSRSAHATETPRRILLAVGRHLGR